MCIQALGKSKWAVLGGWVLALVLVGLCSPGAGYAKKAPSPQATPPSSWDSEIIFNGKMHCSLKRRIDLPFKGVITSLKVHSGQPVKTGDTLATYHLAPEAVMAIEQRLSPPQISDLEVKLSQVERSLVPLNSKQRELNQLVQKQLAAPQGLAQTNQDVRILRTEKATLRKRLQNERRLAKQDQEVLSRLLGTSVKSGQVPRDVNLKAPIDGYIIWINPSLRVGAELAPLAGAFQVGVMNPMLVLGQAFEIEALKIKVGDQAEVTLDSLPGREFQAKVSRVSWSSTTTSVDQPAYYDVELKVPNPDLALKDGLKARIVLRKSK